MSSLHLCTMHTFFNLSLNKVLEIEKTYVVHYSLFQKSGESQPKWEHINWYLHVQSRQCKHQNNMWKLLKVNTKDTRTTSLTSFWCLHYKFWTDVTHCSGVSILDFEQVRSACKAMLGSLRYSFTGVPQNCSSQISGYPYWNICGSVCC